ncbi:recombination-associated protein RdgC [Pseudomonas aeruginosa]|uniref:recombination-associated protein RdgC n=1 Tax=Pseudomonas aeruginosa TaxID=287 RepID=UPI0015F017FF|nr:recombination-associated protein RdgC [Pseudomonas aeruginosa]MBA4890464.1 recombination-associated protein RdgC [Pseudomonas aeruginosa]
MFPREMMLYRITQPLDITPDQLDEALKSKPARPCGSQEMTTYVFTTALIAGSESLVHASTGYWLIAAEKHEKKLKGKVVREELLKRVQKIETEQARKVYKKERDTIKDEVVMDFLPRAFDEKEVVRAILNVEQNLIMVLTSSAKKAEDLLSTLREVLGSLPVRPFAVKVAPSATFTEWLKKQETSSGFFLLDECELRDTHEDGGTVRCKRQDLTGEEIQLHLTSGKLVSKLSLAYEDKFSFQIDDKLTLKRLRFEDVLQEQAERDGGDDAAGQLDASFTLAAMTMGEFLPVLVEALGGELVPEGI